MYRIPTIALLLGALGASAETNAQPAQPVTPARSAASPGTSDRWQYAGEKHGIKFSFKITNECRESGATMAVKLVSTLDYPVTVSFRIKDPDWSKSFARDLAPGEKDTGLKVAPEDGSVCHPYVDEVFVDAKTAQVTKSGEETGE